MQSIVKYAVLVFALSLVLAGCGTVRNAAIVKEISHDTLYLNKLKFDSVYVYQDRLTDRTSDTVMIHNIIREYRYQLLRDTIRETRIDSIPIIREVEVVKTERHTPWYAQILSAFGIIFIVIILIRLIRKIIALCS